MLIRQHPVPDAIVSTSLRRRTANWKVGDARDLSDSSWSLQTDAVDRGPASLGIVHFDAIVDVCGVTLAHGSCVADRLTKKLLVLGWLTGTAARRRLSGRRIEVLGQAYDWHIRHRRSLGVAGLAEWRTYHLTDLFARLASGPVCELVPIAYRIRALADERDG